MKSNLLQGVAGAICALATIGAVTAAHADVKVWIDDGKGKIGIVDVTTGAVSNVLKTGLGLTDIAFIGDTLYGTTHNRLYSIDTSTGTPSLVGTFHGVGGGWMNALVGDGSNLLGASGGTRKVYDVSATTGAATFSEKSPLRSAGDLAFAGGDLYESALGAGGFDKLVDVTTGKKVYFHTGAKTYYDRVFGLADDGTTMYAVNGAKIYSVDVSNGALTYLSNYSGHGLGAAFGMAFMAENLAESLAQNQVEFHPASVGAIPEPSTWTTMLVGFGGLGFAAFRRRGKKPARAVA